MIELKDHYKHYLLTFFVVIVFNYAPSSLNANPQTLKNKKNIVLMLADGEKSHLAKEVFQAVFSQLSDLPVEINLQWVEKHTQIEDKLNAAASFKKTNAVLTVFWFDVTSSGQSFLFLTDAAHQKILVRRLENTLQSDRFEEMAIIVHSSVDAMLQGGEIGVFIPSYLEKNSKTKTSNKTKSVAPEKIKKKSTFLPILWAGYYLSFYSNDTGPLHGPEIDLELNIKNKWFFRTGYNFIFPVKVENKDFSIREKRHLFHLGTGMFFYSGKKLQLGGQIDLAADYVKREVSLNEKIDQKDVSVNDDALFVFSTRSSVELRISLAKIFTVRLLIGLKIFFNRINYTAKYGNKTESVVAVRPLVPYMNSSIGFRF